MAPKFGRMERRCDQTGLLGAQMVTNLARSMILRTDLEADKAAVLKAVQRGAYEEAFSIAAAGARHARDRDDPDLVSVYMSIIRGLITTMESDFDTLGRE